MSQPTLMEPSATSHMDRATLVTAIKVSVASKYLHVLHGCKCAAEANLHKHLLRARPLMLLVVVVVVVAVVVVVVVVVVVGP